jgi:hypothetical protein
MYGTSVRSAVGCIFCYLPSQRVEWLAGLYCFWGMPFQA